MKLLLALCGVFFGITMFAQDGSGADPFTDIGQARDVTAAGLYSFNIDGSYYTTYVDAEGYIQVAVDFGDGLGALNQSGYLEGTSRGILDAGSVATLSEATEVRITSSVGNLDARSSNPVLIDRVANFTSLKSGSADNAANNDWTGVGSANLRVDATTVRARLPLSVEIFHTFGNGSGFHWYPERGDQALTHNNDIAANEKLTLWVRGAVYTPPTGGLGSSAYPFTLLRKARSVTTTGIHYFRLNGISFSTLADPGGYVQVAVDYGYGAEALPQVTAIAGGSRGILTPAALATLTEATQIRMTSTVPGTLEATTTNGELLRRIRSNETLKNRPADNQFSTGWTGAGSEFLRVNATTDKAPNQLQNKIFHTNRPAPGRLTVASP